MNARDAACTAQVFGVLRVPRVQRGARNQRDAARAGGGGGGHICAAVWALPLGLCGCGYHWNGCGVIDRCGREPARLLCVSVCFVPWVCLFVMVVGALCGCMFVRVFAFDVRVFVCVCACVCVFLLVRAARVQ